MELENEKLLIKQSILDLEKECIIYNQNLNTSGIWLFLATLGCWSVSDSVLQILAVVSTFIIFSHKLISGINNFKLFSFEVKDIEKSINSETMKDESKKALLYDLNKIQKKYMSWLRILKYVPAYYISMIFLVLSIGKWIGWI